MTHTGLPDSWAWAGMALMLLVALWVVWRKSSLNGVTHKLSVKHFSFTGRFITNIQTRVRLLAAIRTIVALLFILLVSAGLVGNPIPERNIATVLTWTLWWSGLVIAIFFVGSLWCAICPWDTIASWLVKQKLFYKSNKPYSLGYKVPARFRNLTVASFLFVLLTWFELGYGVTVSPYATAIMALVFVVLAVASMLVFERKAFCQYFCPVGRTIGIYSEISMTALRPIDNEVCANCKTLECYYGNDQIESCPTHQVMGRMLQNSLCISCGQCVFACPHKNIAWAIRNPETDLLKGVREGTSVSVFLIILLALTLFHGVTMLPAWSDWVTNIAIFFGDSGRWLISFTVLMLISIAVVLGVFLLVNWITAKVLFNKLRRHGETSLPLFSKLYFKIFSNLGFATLPVTFAYHIAHNLTHLFRESRNISQLVFNPFGVGLMPLSQAEIRSLHTPLINQSVIYLLQLGLIVVAFVIGVRIASRRADKFFGVVNIMNRFSKLILIPQVIYLLFLAGACLWLLTQPMTMRMAGM